ncbi:MAG TPA: hypothetical protein VNO26_15960 [Candidatus Limnocylindria bacterium]|nr:hypothetical protein [Candidatus Limnocylindria bacterium]
MRKDDDVLVQLATRVPRELHRAIKLHCVGVGMSVMQFVESALRTKLDHERKRPGRRSR